MAILLTAIGVLMPAIHANAQKERDKSVNESQEKKERAYARSKSAEAKARDKEAVYAGSEKSAKSSGDKMGETTHTTPDPCLKQPDLKQCK